MSMIDTYRTWRDYRRTSSELKSLSDIALRDIGLERSEINAYAKRVSGFADRLR